MLYKLVFACLIFFNHLDDLHHDLHWKRLIRTCFRIKMRLLPSDLDDRVLLS